MAVNGRLNMVVLPSEVIWKWQQYGNNLIAVFPLSSFPSKMFYNLSANNPVAVEIKVAFNEMSMSDNNKCDNEIIMTAHKEAAGWISLYWSSLGKK